MALWIKTQQLPKTYLQQLQNNIYGDNFPIEVRHYLAYWIDEQPWKTIDPDHPQYELTIKELMSSFIREIENKANAISGEDLFLNKLKLTQFVTQFKKFYESNPVGLYRKIRTCLVEEEKMVQLHENNQQMMEFKNTPSPYYCNPTYTEINEELEHLKIETQKNVEIIRKLDEVKESFSLQVFELQKKNEQVAQFQKMCPQNQNYTMVLSKLTQDKNLLEFQLQEKIKTLRELQFQIIEKINGRCLAISSILDRVLDNELLAWKRNQQLSGNGGEFDSTHLDHLQNWCEKLSEIMWGILTQIKEAKRLAGAVPQVQESEMIKNNLNDLSKRVTEQITTIVTNTFIIEKQPPQVMKTNTRFTATVRLLVGSKLGIHMNPPQVRVSIISEAQANHLLTERILKGDASGDILNNTGTMEYDQSSKKLSITFRNMQLKKIKRAEKKGSESVVDEKFSLYFSSKFFVGKEFEFQVWTLSLPVTVIVHGNQEPHAWATITWDNAFAEPNRKPFVVPDKVNWGKVAIALNLKFAHLTGRALSMDNMKYLAEKLLKVQSDEFDTMQLSWSQFSKESLPERNFTFWDWFYAIMKLTREHLKNLWTAGLIMGFVRKKQAEDLLSNCQNGTFLLRFSDSELGGITVAWVGGTGEQKEVIMLQPFTAKDFAIRSLADRLNDLAHLQYLYPNLEKQAAFHDYYTPFADSQCSNNNGYVKPILKTHVPGLGGNHLMNNNRGFGYGGLQSCPTTPNSNFLSNSPTDAGSLLNESNSYVDQFSTSNAMDYEFNVGGSSIDFQHELNF